MAVAELVGVSKRFGRHQALVDVSLSIEAASIVGLVGPNGAGKTTMLRIVAGLLRPSGGTVRRAPSDAIRYFGGEQTLPPDVSVKRWLRVWSLPQLVDAPAGTFGSLSRGTRQRVGLEATLAVTEPSLVLLDEPWEGLDPDASRWLTEALAGLRADGHSVIVSSHRIYDLAPSCDRCEAMVGGRVAASVACTGLGPDERVRELFDVFDRARGRR